MNRIKKFLSTPYPYIFLLSYAGVWAVWESIKLPFSNPAEVISYIPSIGYNPTNNLLRFALAVLIPPLACLAYWLVVRHQKGLQKRFEQRNYKIIATVGLVGASMLLALGMGIVQGSTNPANNPPTTQAQGGPFTHALVDTFHEGETLGPAISYNDPVKVPYRDFVIVHGVFQDAVRTTIAFKLFGKSVGASRAMATILTILAFVMLFALFWVLFRGDLVRSAIGMIAFAALVMPAAVIPYWRDAILGVQLPFRDIATMLFLIAAVLGFRSFLKQQYGRVAALSAAVGFIAFAGFANSIDRAFYIMALTFVWLVMLFIMSPGWATVKRIALGFIGGSILGVIVLAIALKGHIGDFWQYLVDITKYKEFLDGIAFSQPRLHINILLLIIAAIIGGVIFWITREITAPSVAKKPTLTTKLKAFWPSIQKVVRDHHTLILLGITALFFMRSALGRALLDHFVYSVQWLYVFIIYGVLAYLYPLRKKLSVPATFLTIGVLVGMLGLYTVMVKKIDIRADTFPVHVTDQQVVRQDYLQAADYLKKNLKSDETFVTLTSEAIWYYLVDKPSPIQYPVIWYAFTKQERLQLADSVDRNDKIKYLVTNDHWTMNFDYVPNSVRFPELYKVIAEKYEPHVGFGSQTIWIKK